MTPRSPTSAWMAPLRVIHSSRPPCTSSWVKLWWQLMRRVSAPVPRKRRPRPGAVHHLVPVGPGVVLGPQHVGDVGLELRRALDEPGQVGVLQARAWPAWPGGGPWRCASAPAGCRCPGCPSAAPPRPGPARRGTARRSGCPSRACRTAWPPCRPGPSDSVGGGAVVRQPPVGRGCRPGRGPGPRRRARPARCGRAAARASRAAGRSVTSSSAATMPQPMSTPTADGMTAPLVGMTEPTVAPMPTWASGMRATWPSTMGRRAVFSAWRMVPGSMSLAHEMSLGLMVTGMVGTSSRCSVPPFSLVRPERVWSEGVEPSSTAWRAGVLAIGRRPRDWCGGDGRPGGILTPVSRSAASAPRSSATGRCAAREGVELSSSG